MAQSSKGARIDQSLDVHGNLFPKIPFDIMVPIYELSQFHDLVLTQILDPSLTINVRLLDEVPCGASPYAIDIGEPNIHPFLPRQINSSYPSHRSSSKNPRCVMRHG